MVFSRVFRECLTVGILEQRLEGRDQIRSDPGRGHSWYKGQRGPSGSREQHEASGMVWKRKIQKAAGEGSTEQVGPYRLYKWVLPHSENPSWDPKQRDNIT